MYTVIKRDGKIIDFDCNNHERFNEILDPDEGSRYIGEFAIGLNPYIEKTILNFTWNPKRL